MSLHPQANFKTLAEQRAYVTGLLKGMAVSPGNKVTATRIAVDWKKQIDEAIKATK